MSDLTDAEIACLTAARPRGLRRTHTSPQTLPGSCQTDLGWWAQSSWSERDVDMSAGGPWSIEQVQRLRELALLGSFPLWPERAEITRLGRAYLKARQQRLKAEAEQQPHQSTGAEPRAEARLCGEPLQNSQPCSGDET